MDELLDTLRAISHFDARLDAYLACHDVDHFPLEQILKTLLNDLVAQRMVLEAKNRGADFVIRALAVRIDRLEAQLAKALLMASATTVVQGGEPIPAGSPVYVVADPAWCAKRPDLSPSAN